MKALVTGAAGFIGSALCERLATDGWDVLGVDNLNDYYPVSLKIARLESLGLNPRDIGNMERPAESSVFPSLKFLKADITDRDSMEGVFANYRPDVVMNLAAQAGVRYSIENPYAYLLNNVDGFLILLECARHWPVRKFVYASSSSIYGGNSKVPFSESDPVDNPMSLYAATKKSNEAMARAYRNLYNVPAVGLRFFTVYGPWGRPDMAPMLFADAITKGEKIKVFNHGDLSRDFTYIDDIVEGVVRVMGDENFNPDHDIYNIGLGQPVNLMDFISILEKALGAEAEKEFLPMQKGDVYTTFADTARIRTDYGYAPSTTLEEGIRRFAEWYVSQKNPLR